MAWRRKWKGCGVSYLSRRGLAFLSGRGVAYLSGRCVAYLSEKRRVYLIGRDVVGDACRTSRKGYGVSL